MSDRNISCSLMDRLQHDHTGRASNDRKVGPIWWQGGRPDFNFYVVVDAGSPRPPVRDMTRGTNEACSTSHSLLIGMPLDGFMAVVDGFLTGVLVGWCIRVEDSDAIIHFLKIPPIMRFLKPPFLVQGCSTSS